MQTSLTNQWSSQLNELITAQIFNPRLSVSWLAEQQHLSERQFARRVQKTTGQTPGELIREVKLSTAYHLLAKGQLETVKATASAFNFSDTKYFSRLFFKRFGLHPSGLIHKGMSCQ